MVIRFGPPKGSAEGSAKVTQVLWCLWSCGADPSWVLKGSVEGSPITSLNLSPATVEVDSHSKVLGANGFRLPEVLWSWSHSLLRFFGLQKFFGGFRQLCFT